MPRRKRPPGDAARSADGATDPTRVLDWHTELVAALAERIDADGRSELQWLRSAYAQVGAAVRPVYALNDRQPVSKTLHRGRGSCSQRLAILEALSRRRGIATRVEGIAVDGQFWYPRFPRMSWLVPERVVLAWPEFLIDDTWVAAGQLFDPGPSSSAAFTNAGEETLFDAIGRNGVVWSAGCPDGVCDLSAHVVENLGYFDDRDALFEAHGQTMCWLARTAGEPVMSHRAASTAHR